MNKSLLLGAVIGGVVAFVWSSISWMAIPWHEATLKEFQDKDAVTQAVLSNAPENGMYVLHDEPGAEATTNGGGPMVFASVQRQGMTSMTGPLITGLVINIIGALLLTWLLLQTTGLSILRSALFVAVAAVAAGVLVSLPEWNWWGFTTGYTIVALADLGIGWFLAGLAIAKFAKPKTA